MSRMRILFLCANNSCRSQMAEGLVNHFFGDKFSAASAGSEPTFVHPLAMEVMKELGIDISAQQSKPVSEFFGQEFDYVITLCADQAQASCPVFMGKVGRELRWEFPDPASAPGSKQERMKIFRQVRDAIRERLEKWTKEISSSGEISVQDSLIFSPVKSEPEE